MCRFILEGEFQFTGSFCYPHKTLASGEVPLGAVEMKQLTKSLLARELGSLDWEL